MTDHGTSSKKRKRGPVETKPQGESDYSGDYRLGEILPRREGLHKLPAPLCPGREEGRNKGKKRSAEEGYPSEDLKASRGFSDFVTRLTYPPCQDNVAEILLPTTSLERHVKSDRRVVAPAPFPCFRWELDVGFR